MTQKEKALKIIAKQIKELDNNSYTLDVLSSNLEIGSARANLHNIITKNGYELTKEYKLALKK